MRPNRTNPSHSCSTLLYVMLLPSIAVIISEDGTPKMRAISSVSNCCASIHRASFGEISTGIVVKPLAEHAHP